MNSPYVRIIPFVLLALALLAAPPAVFAQKGTDTPETEDTCCGYTIEGYKFYDQNGDGVMNGGDYGLAGWSIEATDSAGVVVATTTTDSTGYYQFFTPVWCGAFVIIREVLVPGWSQSFPGGAGTHSGTHVGCGATFGPYNFGNTDPTCLDFAKTYTTDADFNDGDLNGVVTNSDQLELSPTGTTFEFAWIANSSDGTVSKVSTLTGMEVARYYTGPPDTSGFYWNLSPSRTAIDKDGNCWVANRAMGGQGSVTQILVDGGDDRNSNSTIETSFDASANGVIELGEMLPWGQDERVVRHYLIGTGPPDQVPRALAIDKAGFLWVGIYFSSRVVKVDPTLPTSIYGPDMPPTAPPELASVDLNPLFMWPYGLALSPNGMLYAASDARAVEIDPGLASGGTAFGPAVTQYIEHTGDSNYGICVDENCIVWLAKVWGSTTGFGAIRWDPTVGVGDPSLGFTATTPGAAGPGRGITADFDGNIWMAMNDSLNSVAKFDLAGNFIANYPTGLSGGVGVGAGPDGHMIVVGAGSCNWAKIDKNTGAIISLPGPQLTGYSPYTYSDFTGSLQNIVSQQQGFWTVVTDGGFSGLTWVLVDWTDLVPALTSVLVEARTAYSAGGLASEPWTVVFPPGTLSSPMPGRYIETRVRLQRERDCGAPFVTPILYDLTVEAVCDSCYIVSCPPDTVVECDSEAGRVVDYVAPVPNSECDSTWVMHCSPASGSLFPVGNTTVVCEAVNASNDTLECTFQVTVTGDCIQQTTGACCFNNVICDETTAEECHSLGGVYLGDLTDCATADCGFECVRPPQGLTGWWTLDTGSGGVTPNLADPASGGTLFGSPTPVPGSYVTASYAFDGFDDYVGVPDGSSTDLGGSDFSIDFWINTTRGQGQNAILDKFQSSPVRGYRMYLQDGYPALSMANGSGIGSWALSAANGGAAAFVADGAWHFVAVTVDRNDNTGIQFYVDGVPLGTTFNPVPQNGNLSTSSDLVLGRNYAIISSGGYFNGSLDEVEIFRREITAADIAAIYNAGSAGKCREACYASTRTLCCDGEANGSVTICNYDDVAHVYSYGLSPVSGPGCPGLGVTSFSPASGTVIVGPGECLTIPIAMMCPTDLLLGQESCYQATIFNHDTGAMFGCEGSVRRPGWWCIKWEVVNKEIKGIHPVPPATTIGLSAHIYHLPITQPPNPPIFDFELRPVEADGTTPSPSVSLDGLPPGEPVVRGPEIPPEGVDEVFTLRYDTLQPLSFQRVVLWGDGDMDGKKEPLAEFAIRSDDAITTGVSEDDTDETGGASLRPFLALPNPFTASGRISFRIDGDAQTLVSLQLFDLNGREIKRFFRKRAMQPGVHEVDWEGTDGLGRSLPNGVYFLRLETPRFSETVKVVRLR